MRPVARIAAGVAFLTVILTVLVGGHLYMARRLVLDPRLAQPWSGLALAVVVGGALALVLQPLNERTRWLGRSRGLAWAASLWMGFAFYVLVLLGASDLVAGLVGATAEAATGAGAAGLAGPRARAAGVLLVALVAAGLGLRGGLRPPTFERIEVRLRRWPRALEGLRIVQISDLHIGPILDAGFARRVVSRVNAAAPDLVALTGDLVDGRLALLREQVAPFAALRARLGCYFVTGNHDHYSGASAWAAEVARLGLRPLRNERVTLGEGDARFELAGVDDHHGDLLGGGGGEDLEAALAGRDPTLPLVLLAHDPSTFKRASAQGVDLQLSGHTHGGQIWPFRYLVRLAVPFVAGLYRRGDAQLYVSRGTGFWGPPMRLRAPAEITEITLRASDEA